MDDSSLVVLGITVVECDDGMELKSHMLLLEVL
jgi:hypothetical protein